MSSDPYPDTKIHFLTGTLPDGRVLLDFRGRPIDHLKLTIEQTFDLAEGLIEAAKQAREGIIMLPPDSPFMPGGN